MLARSVLGDSGLELLGGFGVQEGASPALARRGAIHDRTDGVPFFVAELALALAGEERLRAGGQGLELVAGADLPLPDSVRDAVLLRASGLSLAGRTAIAAAAVAGQ